MIPEHKDEERDDAVSELFSDETAESPKHVSTIPVVPQLSVALGILVFVFGVTYVGASHSLKEQSAAADEVRVDTTLADRSHDEAARVGAFDDVSLEAKGAIVWDVKNQKALYAKNADESLPLASVTKLMTALLTYELLSPEDRVTITRRAIEVEGDSGFADGEEFTMQDLADLTLITSSNDGATALGARTGEVLSSSNPDAAFVEAMNVRAEELGLTQTSFKNPTGLDLSPTEPGALGSARDVARLMDFIVTNVPDAVALTNVDLTTIDNARGQYHIAKNTNIDVATIDGLIASKTGYTDLAGGNLVVAFNAGLNRPVVVAVLGSSFNGRFADVSDLVARTRRYVSESSR
ncbi:MAG TPA: serine hydrolase [Candidatus Paceibacterota bacterium]|nr:serine hydrolase [Candidatus Paceibacterota bacterium]